MTPQSPQLKLAHRRPSMSSESSSNVLARKRSDVIVLGLVVVFGLMCAGIAFLYVDQPVCDLEKGWTQAPVCQLLLKIATWTGNWQLGPLLIVVMLLAARKHWKRLLNTLLVAYILRTAVVEWLKLITGRPRPRQIPDASLFEGFGGGASFPSGHASFSFMTAMIISAWFPRWRWPAWIGAILISLSRVAVHAHFLSDVIVGAVIGTVAGAVVLWIWPAVTPDTEEEIEQQYQRKREARRRWLASFEGRSARATGRRRAMLVLIVVLFIGATLMAYWFVDPIPGFFENELFQQDWMQMLGQIGRHLGTWDLGPMLVAIALIAGRNYWKRLLTTLVAGYAIQTALTEAIKWLVGRPRPSQIPEHDLFFGPGTDYHSFPSGHASFIFVFATICSYWFPRARPALMALATFVAASRVVLGSHYVSDAVFGALIGVLAGWIVLSIWRPPVRPAAEKPPRERLEAPMAAPRKPARGWKSLRLRPVDDGE
ncbi:MAG: phosphatase PAP2 family protein [Armatimonadia bacterium]|nr:phosphatase PAP2 family protein [Armatimonadia bacterium]